MSFDANPDCLDSVVCFQVDWLNKFLKDMWPYLDKVYHYLLSCDVTFLIDSGTGTLDLFRFVLVVIMCKNHRFSCRSVYSCHRRWTNVP